MDENSDITTEVSDVKKPPLDLDRNLRSSNGRWFLVLVLVTFFGGVAGYQIAVIQNDAESSTATESAVGHSIVNTEEVSEVPEKSTESPAEPVATNTKIAFLKEFTDRFEKVDKFGRKQELSKEECNKIDGISVFNDSGLCAEIDISTEHTMLLEVGGCGGCGAFYVSESSSENYRQLENLPYFNGILYDESPLTPYYIGIEPKEVFIYDPVTDSRESIKRFSEDSRILVCEHGCYNEGAWVVENSEGVFLEVAVRDYDELIRLGQDAIGRLVRVELP